MQSEAEATRLSNIANQRYFLAIATALFGYLLIGLHGGFWVAVGVFFIHWSIQSGIAGDKYAAKVKEE